MSNRWITLTLFLMILLLFGLYFGIQRTALPSGRPITRFFQGIIVHANKGEWTKAQTEANCLAREWEKRKVLIMFNYAEADYQTFQNMIYELKAATMTKNKFEAVSRAQAGQNLWENFLKIIPEP